MRQNDSPQITIPACDFSRLDLLPGTIAAYRTPAREALARELRRARVVSLQDLPSDTVMMHSTVRYSAEEGGAPRIATLVYPGEDDAAEGKLSVLTPLGCALIGLSSGQSIHYEEADGSTKTLTVLAVMRPSAALREG
jgi:regulator of nucleoside diphosphate kinase